MCSKARSALSCASHLWTQLVNIISHQRMTGRSFSSHFLLEAGNRELQALPYPDQERVVLLQVREVWPLMGYVRGAPDTLPTLRATEGRAPCRLQAAHNSNWRNSKDGVPLVCLVCVFLAIAQDRSSFLLKKLVIRPHVPT